MESTSNTPTSSRSKKRQPKTSQTTTNPFRMETPPPIFTPSPMFSPSQFGYPMGFNQPSPTIHMQVAYNEFRFQQSFPNFEFDQTDIRPDTQESHDTEPDVEVVPETQPPPRAREPNTRWTMEEEVALAKGWLSISEDEQVGNAQKGNSFWTRILEYWRIETRNTRRTYHQLNSKWKTLNKAVMEFNGIYNNLLNNRRSGQSDDDVKKREHKLYRKSTNGLTFNFEHAWDVLRMSPKWHTVPQVNTSKRSKTTDSNTVSDGQIRTMDDCDDENEVEFEEPQCPAGKKKGKRPVSTASSAVSSEEFDSLVKGLSGFRSDLQQHSEKTYEQNERKLHLKELKERRKAAQFLQSSEEGHDEDTLAFVRKTKADLKAQYGL